MTKSDTEMEQRDAKRKQRVAANSGIADWASASPSLLQRAVTAVARCGGALRLGYSRDGGVYSIGVYYNGESETDYVRESEGIDGYLTSLIEDFGDR